MARTEDVELTLAQELAEVSRLVEADDYVTTLDRFVGRIVRTVPGCDHATVSVRVDSRVETVAGTDNPHLSGELSLVEAGPIGEALSYHEPRRLDDTRSDLRWPGFNGRLAEAGCNSALVLPLATQTQPSALSLYSRQPRQFDGAAYDVVLLLTLHAEAMFDNAKLYHDSRQLVEHLRTALGTRLTIGQAQGLLMHRFGYQSERAFEAIKNASQNTNTKLREVAAALVEAHEQDALPAALAKFGFGEL